MRKTLTDRLLRSLANSSKPIEIWDQQLRGFGVRVQGRGPVFFAMRRQRGAGRPQAIRMTIGPFPMLKLPEARERARLQLRDLFDGVDPRQRTQAEEMKQPQVEAGAPAITVAAVVDEFLEKHVSKVRTARAIELRIRREILPRWGAHPITEITRANVVAAVDEIAARGHHESARSTLKIAKRLFRWAVTRGYLTASPAADIKARDLLAAARPRQRVLTDSELKLVWRAAGDGTEGAFVRLLVLLGQRRQETASMTWSELGNLDRGLWVISSERMKEAESHSVPLPAMAVEILRSLPRFASCDYVFSAKGERPLTDPARTKKRIDAAIKKLNDGVPLKPWTFHDLRRSFRTGLSTLRIERDIAELCIAHRRPGIEQTYDLYKFDLEKRRAFERWARHFRQILGAGAQVTSLAARRRAKP
jgi:integrase